MSSTFSKEKGINSNFFDHSVGHDKKRPNCLNCSTMNKFFAGEENEMRESEIKKSSYLRSFEHLQKLKVINFLPIPPQQIEKRAAKK